MSEVWNALSDDTRREILSLLKKRPHTAGEIADQFELAHATVSHHIGVLKESGLIKANRRAQTIIYSLNTAVVKEMISVLTQYLEK